MAQTATRIGTLNEDNEEGEGEDDDDEEEVVCIECSSVEESCPDHASRSGSACCTAWASERSTPGITSPCWPRETVSKSDGENANISNT